MRKIRASAAFSGDWPDPPYEHKPITFSARVLDFWGISMAPFACASRERSWELSIADQLKVWAKKVKRDGVTLWFATKHPGVPWYSKALGAFVVAYALSPIDLIPDFIPVLGYLDDVILLPGLIYLAIKTLPAPILAECREQADQWMLREGKKPSSMIGLLLIVAIWIGATWALWHWLVRPWLFK